MFSTGGKLSRACEFCKSKKSKCDKKTPCSRCIQHGIECVYNNWSYSFDKSHLSSIETTSTQNCQIKQDSRKICKPHKRKKVSTNSVLPESIKHSYLKNHKTEESSLSDFNPSDSKNAFLSHIKNISTGSKSNDKLAEFLETKVNIFSKFSCIRVRSRKRINYGPFSWQGLMNADFFLAILEDYVLERNFKLQSKDLFFSGTNLDLNSLDIEHSLFVSPVTERFEIQGGPQDSYRTGNLLLEDLEYKICTYLPPKKVIWSLIGYFFRNLYPFLPIIDESEFRIQSRLIIGEESFEEENLTNVIVEKKSDFAILGSICVILLFSSNIIHDNNFWNKDCKKVFKNDIDENMRAFILNTPINIKLAEIVHLCLNQFNLNRRTSISVLQFVLLIKINHRYDPGTKDGVDECDSIVSLAVAIRMAESLGLNREPGSFCHLKEDKKLFHIYRKIWHLLVLYDQRLSLLTECHMQIQSDSYDTLFPFYFEGCSNIGDENIERESVELLRIETQHLSFMISRFSGIMGIKKSVKLHELIRSIDEIDVAFSTVNNEFLELIYAPLNQNEGLNISNSIKVLMALEFKSFILNICFLLFVYCEDSGHIEYGLYFLHKAWKVIFCEVFPHCFSSLFNQKLCNALFIPSLEGLLQRTNLVLVSFLARFQLLTYEFEARQGVVSHDAEIAPDFIQQVLHFKDSLVESLNCLVILSSYLSTRYCFSWQAAKAFRFLLSSLDDMKISFTSNLIEKSIPKLLSYKSRSFDLLEFLCDNGLGKLEDNLNFKKMKIDFFGTNLEDEKVSDLHKNSALFTKLEKQWLKNGQFWKQYLSENLLHNEAQHTSILNANNNLVTSFIGDKELNFEDIAFDDLFHSSHMFFLD